MGMKPRLPIASLIVLGAVLQSVPHACPKYNRDSQYGGWKSWGDCQDTRAKVLIRDSQASVTFAGTKTCTVDSGLWYDPYSDESFRTAAQVQIEHVIPLSEAHKSGAWAWTTEKRKVFTNFLDSNYHLLPIKGSVNSSKGDRDPAKWMPPNKEYWRQYARNWVKIKNHWGLTANAIELDTLRGLLKGEAGIVFPQEAPEDLCTDTASVFLVRRKAPGYEDNGALSRSPWDLLGRRLPTGNPSPFLAIRY